MGFGYVPAEGGRPAQFVQVSAKGVEGSLGLGVT